MTNLGGHDMETVLEAFHASAQDDQPTCFIAYTIKGFGLPFAGHKDNHAGLMNRAADGGLPRRQCASRPGAGVGAASPASTCRPTSCESFLAAVPFAQRAGAGARRRRVRGARAAAAARGRDQRRPRRPSARSWPSSAKATSALAERIVTTSPDVTVSTNLGGLGEPARHLRPRGRARTCSASRRWSRRSAGRWRRPASTSSSASPRTTCSCCWPRSASSHSLFGDAPAADRHALRSVHQARPRCAELRLLPGRPLPAGGDAVRHHAGAGGRRAPVGRPRR